MNRELEKEFDKIVAEAISKAEKVKCSMGQFADGLKSMMADLMERWEIADAEIKKSAERNY